LTRRAQHRQWKQETTVAQRRAEIDACAAFDAAAALSIARMDEILRLKPAMRRRILGWNWPKLLYVQLHELGADVVVPYAMAKLVASPEVRSAVETVMSGIGEMSHLADPKKKVAYAAARQRVQDSRRALGDLIANRLPG
jgi:hypothetical protein